MTLGEAIDDPTSNDDYVARLLASEAKDKSMKYSALGLQAYMPRRPTDRAPKPNTRFLKNILRDTDSHNAALRRKEEEEARERMRKLRRDRPSHDSRSERRERHRERDRRHRDRSPYDREKEHSSKKEHPDNGRSIDYRSRSKRHRRYREGESESDRESSSSYRRHRGDDRRPMKNGDFSKSVHRSSRHHRDRRSASPKRSRARSRSRSRSQDTSRRAPSTGNSRLESNTRLKSQTRDNNSDSESDPLEDFVGPLPASSRRREEQLGISTRGRGSYRATTSTIDSHFAHDYDPKLDVDISDNDDLSKRPTRRPVAGLMTADDDWDMALEAVRDRAIWKQKGEERLRAAGFDDSTVQRWKQDPAFTAGRGNDIEGNIKDVKWAKKGEGREWDRGKVLNEDGHYDVKAQW